MSQSTTSNIDSQISRLDSSNDDDTGKRHGGRGNSIFNGDGVFLKWVKLAPVLLMMAIIGHLAVVTVLISFPHLTQPFIVYLHWVRFPFNVDWGKPEVFGYRADNYTLGGWHILPKGHSPSILDVVGGNNSSDGLIDRSVEENIDDSFLRKLAEADRVFISFHGNLGNRATPGRPGFQKLLSTIGKGNSHVIALDYRGFGDSTFTTPTESGLHQDALAIYSYITKHISSSKVILVGHSLGTGVATFLARNQTISGNPPAGLVLVAGYSSIPDAAMGYPLALPIVWPFLWKDEWREFAKGFVGEKWENMESLRDVTFCPIYIVHGHRDNEIQPWHARANFISAIRGRMLGAPDFTPQKLESVTLPTESQQQNHEMYGGLLSMNQYNVQILGKPKVQERDRVEGRLWRSTVRPVVPGGGEVWLVESRWGGHNNLARLQVFEDSLNAWVDLHRI
ncbi:Protein abhd12b [Blyttiomyces sp. JEL0837]|nr:Protein abhd12b [Blyttiomyces sp. JEL0837]